MGTAATAPVSGQCITADGATPMRWKRPLKSRNPAFNTSPYSDLAVLLSVYIQVQILTQGHGKVVN